MWLTVTGLCSLIDVKAKVFICRVWLTNRSQQPKNKLDISVSNVQSQRKTSGCVDSCVVLVMSFVVTALKFLSVWLTDPLIKWIKHALLLHQKVNTRGRKERRKEQRKEGFLFLLFIKIVQWHFIVQMKGQPRPIWKNWNILNYLRTFVTTEFNQCKWLSWTHHLTSLTTIIPK